MLVPEALCALQSFLVEAEGESLSQETWNLENSSQEPVM